MAQKKGFRGGFGLTYIIVIMTLISFTAIAFNAMNKKHVRSDIIIDNKNVVYDQIVSIKSRIMQCYMQYPATGLPVADSEANISTLTCPGNSQNLWSGQNGVFLPKLPKGYTGPVYKLSGTTSYIKITSDGTPEPQQALVYIASKFDSSEAILDGNVLTIYVTK